MNIKNIVLIIIFFITSFLFGHAGGLDKNGGHYNRKTGEYHTHGRSNRSSNKNSSKSLSSKKDTSGGYDRDEWKHWIDADGDGQDTRQEVLIEESLVPVTFDERGKVLSGKWFDPFSGEYFTDPKELDVDHVVPLKNAYDSGGASWDRKKKEAYANYLDDPNHLMAVSAKENRSKGSKDPSEWLPPNKSFHCEYIRIWHKIKITWGLSFSAKFANISNIACLEK
ncbi:MAG: YHYH domain-containing protein [Brevinema sp.]